MTDREFLAWIHERLEYVHHENPLIGHMHKLRAIVLATPKDQRTIDYGSGNSSKDLLARMKGAT